MTSSKAQMNIMDDPLNVWMLTNGSAKPDASVINPQLLSPFTPTSPPSGPAHQTHNFMINQTGNVTWVLNDAPFSDPKIPIIQGNVSDGWLAKTTIHMPFNSTIDIIMRIASDSMDMVSLSLYFFQWLSLWSLPQLTWDVYWRWAIPCICTAISSGCSGLAPALFHIALLQTPQSPY